MSREMIINKIHAIGVPQDWKLVLDVNPLSDKVRLSFYQKSGIRIKWIFKHPIWLFQSWTLIREIEEFSYEDLLAKIEKYPFLLETETEFFSV
jgi:hypothetical protein